MRRAAGVVASAALLLSCGDDGGSEEAFCATARRFAEDNPATVFDRYDPADPSGAAALLRETAAEFRAWADEAPGDIDDDVEVIADAADNIAAGFESPSPSAERAAEIEEQFTAVEAASARVTGYARERCAVDLDPAANQATVTTTASTAAP